MTRRLLATVIAGALSWPALALAMPVDRNPVPAHNQPSPVERAPLQQSRPGADTGTLGNGINSQSNGDVTGPGQKARIDTSTKGPLNDVQQGTPSSNDVPQSKHPEPIY
jgi:hypothetical protein